MKSRWTLGAALAACLLTSVGRAQEVQWGRLESGKLENDLRVPGHVIPQEAALSVESARVPGRVTDILKREGDLVAAGDPLFAVSSAECISLAEELRVAQSRHLEDLLSVTHERERQLSLRASPDGCVVLASHGGTLIKRQVELGASFNVGDPLATILDVSRLVVELAIPERDMASVRVGQPVAMELAQEPGRVVRSRVAHILPAIDPVTRTVKARVEPVPLPRGTTLDALVFGRISVGGGQSSFEVPTTALVFHNNQQFLVKRGPPARAIPVEVLNETQTRSSVIPSGAERLKAGDEIAVSGAIYLYNELHASAP